MFTDINELSQKIQFGEDSTIEFKEVPPKRSDLADEISAFANVKGGIILIGVADSGEVIGISRDDLNKAEKMVVEICYDSIKPPLHIFTEKLLIENKSILKIEIPRSVFVHKSSSGYLMREGSSKREMPPDYLARLMQSSSQARVITFDKQLVPNTNKNILQKDLYRRFLPEETAEQEEEDLLLQRCLLVDENRGLCVSVAGTLMCCPKPSDYLNNSFIQAVCYKGKEQNADYQIDAKYFAGPLDQQIADAFKFVEKHNQVSARKDIGRIDYPQYSMKAIFEALVNAVIHRDYAKATSKIRLFMFADRLELYSPGALVNTLTIKNLRYAQATRNELLARLLSEVNLHDLNMRKHTGRRRFLELRGEGVRIIMQESGATSGKTPVYEMFDEELRLTIFAHMPDNSSAS